MENVDQKLAPCAFCGETDFDLIGLKDHLLNDCKVYQETSSPKYPRMFSSRASQPDGKGEYRIVHFGGEITVFDDTKHERVCRCWDKKTAEMILALISNPAPLAAKETE